MSQSQRIVPGQGHWHFDLEIGALDAEQAALVEAQIEQILADTDDDEGDVGIEDTPPEDVA